MRGKSKYSLVKVDLITISIIHEPLKCLPEDSELRFCFWCLALGFPPQIVLPHDPQEPGECEAWLARPCTVLSPFGA